MSDLTRGGRDPGYFGHGVIGKEQYEAEKKLVDEGGSIFGPGVTGLHADPLNTPGPGVTGQFNEAKQPDAASLEQPHLSIEKLEQALEENPALVDTLIEAEFTRPGGVRKGALDALELAELARPDEGREDVLARIAAAREGE